MIYSQTDLITLNKYCELTGVTQNALRAYIKKGQIRLDKHYYKSPNNRIFISIKGMESWVKKRMV